MLQIHFSNVPRLPAAGWLLWVTFFVTCLAAGRCTLSCEKIGKVVI